MTKRLTAYPLRNQTPREANALIALAEAVKNHYSRNVGDLHEAKRQAEAQEEAFAVEHGARLDELTHYFHRTPTSELRQLKEANPEEFAARDAEWAALKAQKVVIDHALLVLGNDLDGDTIESDIECSMIDAGAAYGSREGFRLGLMYALSLTPEKALAALKAMADDEAADALIYDLLSSGDKGGPFSLEIVEPKGGAR